MLPVEAEAALQDCFERTDWQMLREAATGDVDVDNEEYTSAVTGCIRKCTEDVIRCQLLTTYTLLSQNTMTIFAAYDNICCCCDDNAAIGF